MSKKLTLWVILLVIFFGPVQLVLTLRNMADYPHGWGVYESTCPNLWTAIVVREVLLGISMLVWAYTAWVLFRRQPATLKLAKTGLGLGAAFRIAGIFSVSALGGLPTETVWEMIQRDIRASIGVGLLVGGCHLYLARSTKVAQLYGA